ncbi:MAG: septum formation protein Maf [Anaerolineales bacterium]|nr:septum formation protein Maf [Anaerolineales bacterium]
MIRLASSSPRRVELLAIIGWQVFTQPVEVDESIRFKEEPEVFARRLALEKAQSATNADDDASMVLAADTIVVLDDQILGKPEDAEDAKRMLLDLRGRPHQVITAIAVIENGGDRVVIDHCETMVPMRSYSKDEVEMYVDSGDPMDKAGAYAIQNNMFNPVALQRLDGCYANVMGLPLCHVARSIHGLTHDEKERVAAMCQAYTVYDCRVYPGILEL